MSGGSPRLCDCSPKKKTAMSAKKRSKLTSTFEAIDIDGGGTIDMNELKAAMASLSDDKSFTAPTEVELVDAFNTADADGGGSIDLEVSFMLHP